MKLRNQTIKINGRSVSYVEGGEGPPLVYVHGWPLGARPTDSMLQRLAEDFHLYAPNLPGFGKSEPLGSEHTVENFARFLGEFIDALGLEKISLISCSLGGMISLAYALENREKLDALVLIGAAGSHRYLANRFLKLTGATLSRLLRFKSVEKGINSVVNSDRLLAWVWARFIPLNQCYESLEDDPNVADLRRIPLSVSKEVLDSVLRLDLISRCEKLKDLPILLLAGQNDILISVRAVKEIDNVIGTSIFMIVPYAEHWNTLNDDSLRLIKNFLEANAV